MSLRTLLLLSALSASLVSQTPPGREEEAAALLLQARAHQRRAGGDDPERAAALYRRAITLVPGSAEAHLRLSEALAEVGNVEAAIPPAVRATELAPRSAEAWAHLGVLHYFRGRTEPNAWDKALVALQRAARLLPKDLDVLMRLAEVAEGRKQDEVAMDTWLRIGRQRPQATIQGRNLGDIAFERAAILGSKIKHMEGRREALLALCSRSEPDPRHLGLLEELGRDQVERSFLAYAEESFRLLAKHVSEEPGVHENVALIQLQTGRFAEALPVLAEVKRLRQTQSAAYYTAVCLMNLGRFQEAEAELRTVLAAPEGTTKDPRKLTGSARELMAWSLLLQGRPKDALDFLQSLPPSALTGALLGIRAQALLQTQQWRAARTLLREGMRQHKGVRIFQMAALIPPKVFNGSLFSGKQSREALSQIDLESMASLWAEFRQWERALQVVQAARAAAPVRDVELLLLHSNVLEQLGRTQESLAVLREGQRMAPDHPILMNNLGYTLLENGGDLVEAARLIEAALKKDPQSGSTMDSYGWVLFKQGKFTEAEAALRKAVELSPFSPEIRRHFGEVLLKLDRPTEALEQWERALAFVFPGRSELEKRTQELRIAVAKRRMQQEVVEEEPMEPEPEGELEELP